MSVVAIVTVGIVLALSPAPASAGSAIGATQEENDLTPWCFDRDDPRCSQDGPPGSHLGNSLSEFKFFVLREVRLERNACNFIPTPVTVGLGPQATFRNRLERPPRAV